MNLVSDFLHLGIKFSFFINIEIYTLEIVKNMFIIGIMLQLISYKIRLTYFGYP